VLRVLIVDEGAVSRGGAEEALGTALKAQARKWYNQHTAERYGDPPDHCPAVGALAYALTQDEFTGDEVKKIRFDHDETPETFSRSYGMSLDKILDALMEVRKPISTVSDVCLKAGH